MLYILCQFETPNKQIPLCLNDDTTQMRIMVRRVELQFKKTQNPDEGMW